MCCAQGLLAPHRRFIMEGRMGRLMVRSSGVRSLLPLTRQVHAYLFNDVLIFSQRMLNKYDRPIVLLAHTHTHTTLTVSAAIASARTSSCSIRGFLTSKTLDVCRTAERTRM